MANPWSDFKVPRKQKEDSLLTRMLVSLFIIVVCAGLLGAGFAFYYFAPGHYGGTGGWRMRAAENDTKEKMTMRFLVGAGIGAAAGAATSWKIYRSLGQK